MPQGLPLLEEHRQVVKGDDYLKADGRALVWESSSFPNLEGAVLEFIVGYSNTNIFGSKAVNFPTVSKPAQPKEAQYKEKAEVEIKGSELSELGTSLYDYILRAEIADKSKITLASGKLTVMSEPGQAPLLPPF